MDSTDDEQMRIVDAQELKRTLEDEVKSLLTSFEERTGLEIEAVNMDRLDTSRMGGSGAESQLVDVHIKTVLR